MRSSRLATVLLAIVGACAPGRLDTTVPADEVAIRDLIRRTAAANNAADSAAWVALFADDAVYLPPGSAAVTTRDGLRAAAATGFGRFRAEIQIAPVEIVVTGDWAFARTNVTGQVTPRSGGAPIPVNVKQLVVYRRQTDRGWKIARMMSNDN